MKQKVDLLGICLKRIFTQDKKVKALLLTKQEGLVWVYSALAGPQNKRLEVLCPGVLGIYGIRLQKAHQGVFYEGRVVESFLSVKKEYARIVVFQNILFHLDKTQWQKKELSLLFDLVVYCLKALETQNPEVVEALFLIKLMLHEGILAQEPHCVECGQFLNETYRLGGEVFCVHHRLEKAQLFSNEEENTLSQLAKARKKEQLGVIEISSGCLEKLRACFREALINV